MYRRWCYLKIYLHVSFRRCPPMDLRVRVNECQVLALKAGELVHRPMNFMRLSIPSATPQLWARRPSDGQRTSAAFTSLLKHLPIVLKIFQKLWVYARKRRMLEVLSKPVSFSDKNQTGHNEVLNSIARPVEKDENVDMFSCNLIGFDGELVF